MVITRQRGLLVGGGFLLTGLTVSVATLYSPYTALAFAGFFLLVTLITKVELFFYGFLCSLMLLPKFTANGINIRIEDGIAIFFAAQLTILWMSRKEISIPSGLRKAVLTYLGFSLLISMGYVLFGDLPTIYMMFWLKEVQYILYLVIAFYCAVKQGNTIHRLLTALFIASLGWGLYQLLANKAFGFYGIGLMSETASSQSGGAFFIITIFMFYQLHKAITKKTKSLYLGLTLLSTIVTFSTVSRTAITALVAVTLVFLPMYLLKKGKAVIRLYFTGWGIILVYFCFPLITRLMGDTASTITGRLSGVSDGANTRMDNWSNLLSFNDTLMSKIIGLGKGFPQLVTGGFRLGADSQYVRLLSEVGIVGLILFLIVILCIVRFAIKHWKIAKPECMLLLMLVLGFMVMSFTHEVFAVTIQASLFWTLTGIFIARITTIREGGFVLK